MGAAGDGVERAGRRWRRFGAGYALSAAGQSMAAVPVLVLVHERTGSLGWMAVVAAARLVPYLLVSPVAGVLADRVDRRGLLRAAHALRAAGLAGARRCRGRGRSGRAPRRALVRGDGGRHAVLPGRARRRCATSSTRPSSTGPPASSARSRPRPSWPGRRSAACSWPPPAVDGAAHRRARARHRDRPSSPTARRRGRSGRPYRPGCSTIWSPAAGWWRSGRRSAAASWRRSWST